MTNTLLVLTVVPMDIVASTDNVRQRQNRSDRRRKRSRNISDLTAAVAIVVSCCSLTSTPRINAFHSAIDLQVIQSRLKSIHLIERTINSSPLDVARIDNAAANGYEDFGDSISSSSNPTYDITHGAILRSKRELEDHIYRNQFEEAMTVIQHLLQIYSVAMNAFSTTERRNLCSEIDTCIQELLAATFATPTNDRRRTTIGMDIMNIQLSDKSPLAPPYNTIPRRIILNAIGAITSLSTNDLLCDYSHMQQSSFSASPSRPSYLVLSYRLLQRLISGVGMRGGKSSLTNNKDRYSRLLSEKEFNQVLHAHCKSGYMVSAERIVHLQERTIQRLPISIVTFSILLKGYGQEMNLAYVESTIQRTKANHQTLDTIMVNTMIDAYINCNAMDQAETLFSDMRNNTILLNRRTYNTYMKGLAKQGALAKAQNLAVEMKQRKLWDSITTNTLVHASVIAGNLTFAEEILDKETMRSISDKFKYQQHPNVEAYTELLDAYAKANQLDRSLSVLQTMQRRNVEPNEVTYICLMGGLGRNQRIDLAQKIIVYMQSNGQRPTTKIYNALISGLLLNDTNTQDIDRQIDDGIKLLRDMKLSKIPPNAVTISVIVDALGRCKSPRVVEAQLLVDELSRTGYVSTSDNRVLTSLLHLYGKVNNFQGVTLTFQKLKMPDTAAVNAYIDACYRCGREKAALDAFALHLRTSRSQRPDIVTYAILIGSILKHTSVESLRQVRLLYTEMKTSYNIYPDNGLVDVILKNLIRIGSSRQLTRQHVALVADVLNDAERLSWDEGQLNRRKRAIRAIIIESFGNTLRPNDPIFALIPTPNDDLFDRKGWNQVHSGFRIWGQIDCNEGKENVNDKNNGSDFLKSRGWNDVDSSFRLI